MPTRTELLAAAQALRTQAQAERRPLSPDESARFDALLAAVGQLDATPAAITPPPGPAGHSGGITAHSGGSTVAQGNRYQELLDQRAELVRASKDVIAQAERDGRNLTPEQLSENRGRQAQVAYLNEQIEMIETQRDQERVLEGGTPRIVVSGPSYGGAPSRKGDAPWGYDYGVRMVQGTDGRSRFGGIPNALDVALGDMLVAVAGASTPGATIDPRLFRAAASGASTGVPSDGGFVVQSDFSTALMEMAMTETVLAQRARTFEISGTSDSLEAPYVDETSRATGSRWGGVRIYRRSEAATVTASNPKFGKFSLELEDLMGIAYVTSRLLQDAAALGQVFRDAFVSEFAFVLDDEIYRGTGAGQCAGIIDSTANPALVTQAIETGQSLTNPIVAENVMKMRSRLWPRSRANAAWFINLELEPYMQQMNIGIGTGGQLVYMPPGGLTQAPYGTLFGLPVIPIETASAVGTVGDICLADLSQYILIRKGGIDFAESMHVRFLYGESTYRWMQRVNGKSKWRSALTPYKGTNTLSPFVVLNTRS